MKIILRTAHTHAGVDYKAGDPIDVPEADAAWIEANIPAPEFPTFAAREDVPAKPDAPLPTLVEREPALAVVKRDF